VPTTFDKAMLATPLDREAMFDMLDEELWVCEQKFDGHRIILYYTGRDLFVYNRNGDQSQHQTRIREKIEEEFRTKFGSRQIAFDSELVDETLFVFDCIQYSSKGQLFVSRSMSFRQRRVVLENIFDRIHLTDVRIVPQAKNQHEKLMLTKLAVERGYEGIILKNTRASYSSGKSPWMRKYKFTKTADLLVFGRNLDGKNNLALHAMNGQSTVLVGHCGLGAHTDIEVGNIVEVRYLHVGTNGHLVQPVLLRRRDDKTPQDIDDIASLTQIEKGTIDRKEFVSHGR